MSDKPSKPVTFGSPPAYKSVETEPSRNAAIPVSIVKI